MKKLLKFKWVLSLVFVSLLLVLLVKRSPPEVISLEGRTMGTTFNIKYVDNGHGILPAAILKDIEGVFEKINAQMSTYDKESELSRFNQSESLDWQKISPGLFRVIEHALSVAKKTEGAFDPTIGPLVNLWGFGPEGKREVPSRDLLIAAKKRVGHQKITLNKSSLEIKKSEKNLYLDLSASAKGFGVDTVSLYLRRQGIENHMIEVGGEVRVSGTKNGIAWRIAIEAPVKESSLGQKVLKLKNASLATSGSYRNFFISKGQKYSHAINYQSGAPIEHSLISVSVIGLKSCMEADSWATALMVMGPEKGQKMAKELGLAAFFIYMKGDQLVEVMNPEFSKYLEVKK